MRLLFVASWIQTDMSFLDTLPASHAIYNALIYGPQGLSGTKEQRIISGTN
jgi:hypothetical protein